MKSWKFDTPSASAINKARLDHLASLDLSLQGKMVLEVGSGIGLLTPLFESLECDVVSTDGRESNVAENLRRHPWREGRVFVADLEEKGSHGPFPIFDIVFCYGTLYHTSSPAQVLRDLARVCRGMLLLESRVWPVDDGEIHVTHESTRVEDQGLHGCGCQPARDWIMDRLQELFEYSYVTKTQPDHPEFPTMWPVEDSGMRLRSRSVFVASRYPLSEKLLSASLLNKQGRAA
jgi:SAM-dependent methyltransferase